MGRPTPSWLVGPGRDLTYVEGDFRVKRPLPPQEKDIETRRRARARRPGTHRPLQFGFRKLGVMEEIGQWLISPRPVVARRADPQFLMMALTADTDGYLHHTANAL